MDEAWKILDSIESVENSVNTAYYGVAAYYYKVSTLRLLFVFAVFTIGE
jgi:hypothetical protein